MLNSVLLTPSLINQSIYLSIYLFIYLSIYLFAYLSIYHSIYLWLYSPLLDLGRFFSFLDYTQRVGPLGPGISPSQGLYLYTEQHKRAQAQNKRKQTSLPWTGIEHTIPAFERAKTVHALDRAATAISLIKLFII
jgi:hypothetical protein